MAIGTTAAILGSAVIGAVASSAGASKNSKAINQATQAQTQAASDSNALTRDIYNQNKGILSPYVQQGYAATNALSGLLGLQQPANDPAMGALRDPMQALGRDQVTTQGSASPYQQAFDNYRNSTGYQFRMDEGMKGLNASFAARGLGNSGASAKAALQFGQNIGSQEFGSYLGQLGQQQQVGFGAGSALAGVGVNMANTISANNNQAASAIGNGALAGASNSNALYGNLAGIAGQTAGYLSSYGAGAQRNPYGIAGGGIY